MARSCHAESVGAAATPVKRRLVTRCPSVTAPSAPFRPQKPGSGVVPQSKQPAILGYKLGQGYDMSALAGKAGEALVAAELMRRGVSVAYPAYDGGIDPLAYRELDFSRVVPIQSKTRSSTCYNFQRSWFRIRDLVLVQVWHVSVKPEFYIFRNRQDVEEALEQSIVRLSHEWPWAATA
jgi:hypothetical protein